MEEKIFAGVLTWALVMAFIFSIELIAQLENSQPRREAFSKTLASDLQIFNEQIP